MHFCPCLGIELCSALTCITMLMACLWLSKRAGEGAAGSSASVDILSRMVPITRVLYVEDKVRGHTIELQKIDR